MLAKNITEALQTNAYEVRFKTCIVVLLHRMLTVLQRCCCMLTFIVLCACFPFVVPAFSVPSVAA
jgi:hypothetical protein